MDFARALAKTGHIQKPWKTMEIVIWGRVQDGFSRTGAWDIRVETLNLRPRITTQTNQNRSLKLIAWLLVFLF